MQFEVTGTRFGQPKPQTKKNTAVIGISDLNRMKIGLSNYNGSTNKEEDRKRLKGLSDARVKNWPNTIQALREKKETERFEKFEREEMERRKIETEEAAYQAGLKNELMDKAKLEMFRRHDKVKKLHSTMLYSDVLQVKSPFFIQ